MGTDVLKIQPGETVMDRWVCRLLIDLTASKEKKDAELRKNLQKEIDEYALDIAGPAPSPSVWILAETASICLFTLRLFEARYASAANTSSGMSIAQAKFHLTKIDRAHARLMSTLKTLATVRRLAVPAVQINVARQQVNQQVVTHPAST